MKIDNLRTVSLSEIIDLPAYPVAKLWFIVPGSTDEVRKVDTITLPELADSILENGLLNPLVLYTNEGVTYLLDGRNRREASVLAAKVSKTEVTDFMIEVQDFVGIPDEADEFVFVCNDRRDTNSSQRAMSAAMFATDPDCAPAFARMQEKAQAAFGRRNDLGPTLALGSEGVNEQLAKRFHVSVGYVKDALKKKRDEIANREAAAAEAARAEKLANEAESQRLKAEEIRIEDEEKARELIKESNKTADKASQARENANEKSQAASDKASQNESIWKGRKSLRDQKSPGQKTTQDDPLAKFRSQLNSAGNKFQEAADELLDGGRPEDRENVRLKYSHICERFDSIDAVELQTQHYFPTEREPSDEASRWAGEVRIRLGGVDKIIQEKDVIPSMVTKNVEFLEIVYRLRGFLDEVEKALDVEP